MATKTSKDHIFINASPNARLLGRQVGVDQRKDVSWFSEYLKVHRFVTESGELGFAGPYVDLYFFAPFEKMFELPFWVAREIIGNVSHELEEPWIETDLDRGQVIQKSISSPIDLEMEQLPDWISSNLDWNEFLSFGPLADTWRIRLKHEISAKELLHIELFIDENKRVHN